MQQELKGFQIMKQNKEKEIIGGFNVVLAATLVPLGISIFNALIGGIRSLQSQKGEMKLNDATYKWENEAKYKLI